jgi:DNA-binding NarL/FixJ family response regulator
MKKKNISVIIADDHKIFRDGFKIVLESIGGLNLIAEANDGIEFLEIFSRTKPDLVFLDIKMPKLNGLELVKKIREVSKEIKIIVLTAIEDSKSVAEVIENGADGFLLKSADYKTIEKAVNSVLSGKSYFSEDILDAYLMRRNAGRKKETQDIPKLTKREKQILELVCSGSSVPEISDRLQISKRTVEKHKANIMTKAQVRSTSELIVFAFKAGLTNV